MLRTLVSRSIMAVLAVVVVAFFSLLTIWSSGEESLAQGVHHRRVHATKIKGLPPVHLCNNDGAMGPCGCPLNAVSEDGASTVVHEKVFGSGAHDVTVIRTGSYFNASHQPDPHLKWRTRRHFVICAVYDVYQQRSNLTFHTIRLKSGPTRGHTAIKRENASLTFWMKRR